MARTVNEQEYAAKRNEILDTVSRLVFTKGFEQMTIGDILKELDISSGAFYHYFDSKPALLEAFIERIQQATEAPLLPVLRDPELTAVEKLQAFFDTLDRLRLAQGADLVALGRIWYTDGNALVRQKVEQAVVEQRAPLLAEIVRQGLREGVFTTPYPEQSGEIILALQNGMGNTHAQLLFMFDHESGRPTAMNAGQRIAAIVTTHAAYMEAIERVLGAPPNSLYRVDAEAVRIWVELVQNQRS